MSTTHDNAGSAAVHDIGHWIGGQSIPVADIKTSAVFNPATGAVSARVALATREDTHRAVASAARAFPAWSQTPPHPPGTRVVQVPGTAEPAS